MHSAEGFGKERQVDSSILDALIDTTDAMLVYLDRDFNFVRVNKAYAETCRMRPEAMIGKNHFDLYPDAENEVIFRRVRDTGEPVVLKDKPITFPDQPERGTAYWDWYLAPIKDSLGTVSALVLSLHETTRKKLAEDALRNSERLYRAIGESINYGVWVCAPDGRNIYASDSFLKLVGLTQRQCSDFGWGNVLHPDDAERTIGAWKECVRIGGNWDIEHRFRGVDGGWHTILARGVPVRDDKGEIICWAGINLDISRIRDAEEKSHRQNSILQGVNRILEYALRCESMQDLGETCLAVAREITQSTCGFLCELNSVGDLENIAMSRSGWTSVSAPRAPFIFKVHGIYGRVMKDGRAFFTNDPASHPDRIGFPEGHHPVKSFLGAPLIREGRTIGMIAVGNRDGGYGQPELEAIEALAPVVVEAFASRRAEEALYAAKAEAEEANRAKDRFLALLGHELRNPLAPMRHSVALLKRLCPPDPAMQRAQEMIDRQIVQMTRLTDDLLDVSRIASGKITLRREEIDLTELVRCTVEDHRAMLESGGLEVEFTRGDTPIVSVGDKARISQIIGNLLQNSAKFTDAHGRVTVDVRVTDPGFAEITVSDTGVGMDAEILARLFQPFAQADSSLDRSRGGLGLGLALAKGIVDLHGGTIVAASDGAGRGSTFKLKLPAFAAGAMPSAATPAASPASRPLSILVIEDNADAAESLRILLELAGHRVSVAATGRAGLEAAGRELPDVVLCDIGLPEMDGYAVARALRADQRLRSAHLIAMTGYGLGEDKEQARRAGFDSHITKPADFDRLERLLASLALKSRDAEI